MICKPVLGTGLACDEFDRFVLTMPGTNILHNKVGITYQARFKDKVNASDTSITEDMVTEQLASFSRNMDVTSLSTSQI